MESDFYSILGVDSTVQQEEIEARYNFLVRAFHPDRFRTNSPYITAQAEAAAKAVNEAYQTLSKPESRERYDRKRLKGATSDNALRDQLSKAQARIETLETQLKEAKRKAASSTTSKQTTAKETELANENAELKRRVKFLSTERNEFERQLDTSNASVQRLSLENDELKKRVKTQTDRSNKLVSDLAEQTINHRKQNDEWALEKAQVQQQLDAFHASIQRLTTENIGYRNKVQSLEEELTQSNRAALLEQTQLRNEVAAAIQQLAQLNAEREDWQSQLNLLRTDTKQLTAEKERLRVQLEASRSSARQLASEYEALNTDHVRLRVCWEEAQQKSHTRLTLRQRWGTLTLPNLLILAIGLLLLAILFMGIYQITGKSSNKELTAPIAVQTDSTTANTSLPTDVSTPLTSSTVNAARVIVEATLQPTATFTSLPTPSPSPTPMPTSTPTPAPTPTITPFTYPTIAYNYDTRRGEGWEQYKDAVVGLPVHWTGIITHMAWFGGDVSVDVGQNNGWRDVTLELGDSEKRKLLNVGDKVTFTALIKNVGYSFGLETRLSNVLILEVVTPTPTPVIKTDN